MLLIRFLAGAMHVTPVYGIPYYTNKVPPYPTKYQATNYNYYKFSES